jgi:hypothetical protein
MRAFPVVMPHALALALGLAGVPAAATAQTAVPEAAPGCTGAAHRAFDFWLGTWSVHGGPDGDQLLGRNRIERSANGCWLAEHWESASGARGTSLNAWDAQHRVWRQFWVGASGDVLRLEGGLQEGSMVMQGVSPGQDGGTRRQRIRWTPNADGSVTQRWDSSNDGGDNWDVVFVGEYRRTEAGPAREP